MQLNHGVFMNRLFRMGLLSLLFISTMAIFAEDKAPILAAIDRGDIETFRELLDSEEEFRFSGMDCYNSLFNYALFNGTYEVAKMLFERGADVSDIEYRPCGGAANTALFANIERDNYEMIVYLIELGAELNMTDDDFILGSPTYVSLKEGKYRIFELLLKSGATPMERDSANRSAYNYAFQQDDRTAIDILAKYGYSTNRRRISADVGLRMRSAPSLEAEKLGVIPYGEQVILLEERGAVVEIAGAKGHWSRVRWKNREGWVFGGFLSLVRR